MTPANFALIADFLKRRSGLVLGPDKEYLLQTRLTPLLRKHALAGLDELAKAVAASNSGPIAAEVVEAMTTNESLFFRDSTPFDQLRTTLLPRYVAERKGQRALRIWSAACSHGQEAYSIAMTLKEFGAQLAGWRLEILATDIAQEVLARAKSGLFTQFEVQRGLPIQLLLKYFAKAGLRWEISAALKSMVNFKELNLLDDPKGLGQFDLIFCRNVLIYFDAATKTKVLGRLAAQLAPDGVLFLGGAETVVGLSDAWKLVPGARGMYQLAEKVAPARRAAAAG